MPEITVSYLVNDEVVLSKLQRMQELGFRITRDGRDYPITDMM